MAREAVKVDLTNSTGHIKRYTCSDSVAITKGTLLALSDPRTAAAQATANQPIAGIAAEAKEASDGKTSIGVWTDGVFEMYASGSITAGNPVVSGNPANYVQLAGTQYASSGACIIGWALEDATTAEVINVRLRL